MRGNRKVEYVYFLCNKSSLSTQCQKIAVCHLLLLSEELVERLWCLGAVTIQ